METKKLRNEELQRINMDVDRDLWKVFRLQAIKEEIPLNKYMEKMLANYLVDSEFGYMSELVLSIKDQNNEVQ